MGKSLREFLAIHNSVDLTDLEAYERITGPIGNRRHDINAANVCQTVANTVRHPNRNPFTILDFLPDYEQRARDAAPTLQELEAKVAQVFSR